MPGAHLHKKLDQVIFYTLANYEASRLLPAGLANPVECMTALQQFLFLTEPPHITESNNIPFDIRQLLHEY